MRGNNSHILEHTRTGNLPRLFSSVSLVISSAASLQVRGWTWCFESRSFLALWKTKMLQFRLLPRAWECALFPAGIAHIYILKNKISDALDWSWLLFAGWAEYGCLVTIPSSVPAGRPCGSDSEVNGEIKEEITAEGVAAGRAPAPPISNHDGEALQFKQRPFDWPGTLECKSAWVIPKVLRFQSRKQHNWGS